MQRREQSKFIRCRLDELPTVGKGDGRDGSQDDGSKAVEEKMHFHSMANMEEKEFSGVETFLSPVRDIRLHSCPALERDLCS